MFYRLIVNKSNTVYLDPKHVWILEPPTRHDVSNVCYRFHVFPGVWHPEYRRIPAHKDRCEAARSLCNYDCLCHAEPEQQHDTQARDAGFVGKMMDQTGQVSDLVCEPWDRSSKAGQQCIRFCTYTRSYCQCPLHSLVEPSTESW